MTSKLIVVQASLASWLAVSHTFLFITQLRTNFSVLVRTRSPCPQALMEDDDDFGAFADALGDTLGAHLLDEIEGAEHDLSPEELAECGCLCCVAVPCSSCVAIAPVFALITLSLRHSGGRI